MPVVPQGVGGHHEDQAAEDPLDREHPEDDLAADLLTARDQRRLIRRACHGRRAGYVGAAAQALPGLLGSEAGPHLLAQVRVVRRIGDMAVPSAAEQAPVHALQPMAAWITRV